MKGSRVWTGVSLLLLGVLILGALGGCGQTPPPTSTPTGTATPTATPTVTIPPMKLRLSLSEARSADSIHASHARKLAELIQQYTDGAVKVDLYGVGELYSATGDMWKATFSGIIDITVASLGTMTSAGVPEVGVMTVPGLFGLRPGESQFTDKYINAFIDDPKGGGKMAESIQAKGGKFIHGAAYDVAAVFTRKPFKTLADFKGLKIRASVGKEYLLLMEAIGAQAVPMAGAEVYTALQQGLLDGVQTSTDYFVAQQFYDVCKYFVGNYRSNGSATAAVMGMPTWNKLSPAVQDIIMKKVVPDLRKYMATDRVPRFHTEIGGELKKYGVITVNVPDEDIKRTQTFFEGTWAEARTTYGSMFDAAVADAKR